MTDGRIASSGAGRPAGTLRGWGGMGYTSACFYGARLFRPARRCFPLAGAFHVLAFHLESQSPRRTV